MTITSKDAAGERRRQRDHRHLDVNVALSLSVTEGGRERLPGHLSEAKIGTTCTLITGSGDDTVIVSGVGGRRPPTTPAMACRRRDDAVHPHRRQRRQTTLSVSLDYQGNPDDPGYALGGSAAGTKARSTTTPATIRRSTIRSRPLAPSSTWSAGECELTQQHTPFSRVCR